MSIEPKEIVRAFGYVVGIGVLGYLVVTGKATVETLLAFVGGLSVQGLPVAKKPDGAQ